MKRLKPALIVAVALPAAMLFLLWSAVSVTGQDGEAAQWTAVMQTWSPQGAAELVTSGVTIAQDQPCPDVERSVTYLGDGVWEFRLRNPAGGCWAMTTMDVGVPGSGTVQGVVLDLVEAEVTISQLYVALPKPHPQAPAETAIGSPGWRAVGYGPSTWNGSGQLQELLDPDVMIQGTPGGFGIGSWNTGAGDTGVQILRFRIYRLYSGVAPTPTPDSPQPPGPDDFQGFVGPAYQCVLTTTVQVTDTTGTVYTNTVEYRRPANFLRNWSFEEPAGDHAAEWNPVVDGTGGASVPNHYVQTLDAHGGSRVIVDVSEYQYWQGNWLGGKQFTALFGAWATGPNVRILYDGTPVATSVWQTITYFVPFSGTHAVGGGSPYFIIDMPGYDGRTAVDSAFLFPWDEETMTVDCDPSYFDPYDPEMDGAPSIEEGIIGGVPTPVAGAGSTCYICFTPSTIGASGVSLWIAWLGCVIRNMFACSLRVWLLVIGNWINGVVQYLSALSAWIPMTTQAGVNWFAGSVVPALGASVTIIEDSGTNLADVIIALINLLGTLIQSLTSLALTGLNTLVQFAMALQGALHPEPYEFGLNGITDPGAGGLAAEGPNDHKRLWLFLVGFATLDQLLVQYQEIVMVLMVASGAAAIGVILWSFRWWREFIQF